MASGEAGDAEVADDATTRQKTSGSMEHAIHSLGSMTGSLDTLDMRAADPDAQATVTDFLDFTEYLPSDMVRSLALIGKLDETYTDSSLNVHNLTTTWGNLPSMAPEERPAAPKLRADISRYLSQAVSSRVYAHAEAVRMAENVSRHYSRAQTILAKLQTMLDKYPTAEEPQKSPVARARSPQMVRAAPKMTLKTDAGGPKVRRPRVPRITVPGEVLAPYELDYETYSDESDRSSDDDEDELPLGRTPGSGHPRIKLVKNKGSAVKMTPKGPRGPRSSLSNAGVLGLSTSFVLSQLKPPPENAVIGSADAPWLQLTPWELAKLRKRMKKNAQWAPSETMITRELKNLGRGSEAHKMAKTRAEEEGKPFPDVLFLPPDSQGASSQGREDVADEPDEADVDEGGPTADNTTAKDHWSRLAVEEAEESARKTREYVQRLQGEISAQNGSPGPQTSKAKPKQKKRKRESLAEADAVRPDGTEASAEHPAHKRTKTETPVPVPRLTPNTSNHSQETPIQPPQQRVAHSTTPIPLPTHSQEQTLAKLSSSASPVGVHGEGSTTVTTTVPLKAAAESHMSPPAISPRQSTTPILPPVRETRSRDGLRKEQQREMPPGPTTRRSSSRPATPAGDPSRRPASRGGKAASQEPQPSAATDRPRRASTARNTPAPESRQPGKQPKKPAPGVVSRTSSGGNSAVGKRKAAPERKKTTRARKEKGAGQAEPVDIEEEVDDDGNIIDPDEPRYCLCNRVSFGTMIMCENTDSCSKEWFHLECVGLEDTPARTTKWYCPECRVLLNIGEKGEVSARGVRA